MTSAKELLEQATPLPWSQPHPPTIEAATIRHIIREHGTGPQIANTILAEDAALTVYAVNRLPDYEAAVDALAGMIDHHDNTCRASGGPGSECIVRDDSRAALARLRGTE